MTAPHRIVAGFSASLIWAILLWFFLSFLWLVPEPVVLKMTIVWLAMLLFLSTPALARHGTATVSVAAVLLAVIQVKYLVYPVLSTLCLISVLSLLYLLKFSRGRLFVAHIAALFFGLAALEGYWAYGRKDMFSKQTVVEAGASKKTRAALADPDLGFRYLASAKITETALRGTEQIYRATYTTDRYGWRMAPAFAPDTAPTVLFLGCSFAFGQGVNDEDTLVAAFLRESNGRWQALNFSSPGYGPHQLLRLLERKLEQEPLSGKTPAAAIYVAIPDHVPRAAGLRFWDLDGPRYELMADGSLRHLGSFRDGLGAWRSFFLQSRFLRDFLGSIEATPRQQELYLAMVANIAEQFESRYHVPLYVFYWGGSTEKDQRRITELRARGLRVWTLEQVVPPDQQAELYYKYDGHPRPQAHRQVGAFLAKALLEDLNPGLPGS